ncbi:putative magnesium transporter MRS2 [Helianthus anomalus]
MDEDAILTVSNCFHMRWSLLGRKDYFTLETFSISSDLSKWLLQLCLRQLNSLLSRIKLDLTNGRIKERPLPTKPVSVINPRDVIGLKKHGQGVRSWIRVVAATGESEVIEVDKNTMISTSNLEHAHRIKSRLVALTRRVQKVEYNELADAATISRKRREQL